MGMERKKAVPGEGPRNAKVAFIGEAPGWQEDKTGRPFRGQAGQVLDEELQRIGLERPTVFILNVLNCKPARNRDPKPSELEPCSTWVRSQLDCLYELQVVVALGRYASLYLCPSEKPKDIRGTARRVDGLTHLFLFHPAAALHNPKQRPELSKGFDLLRTLL